MYAKEEISKMNEYCKDDLISEIFKLRAKSRTRKQTLLRINKQAKAVKRAYLADFRNTIISQTEIFNYDKNQLDTINWLARKRFVFDPFIVGGYFNEFISYTHENIQNNDLKDLRLTYNLARDKFYSENTIM